MSLSGEAIAFVIVTLVAIGNIIIFGPFAKAATVNNNESLAQHFMTRHAEINKTLYAKQNTIITVTEPKSKLVTTAYADTPATPTTTLAPAPENTADSLNSAVSEDTIEKPAPDTVTQLVSKQITVYTTEPNDTISSIAQKFNVSTETVKWANNLNSDMIKPGWQLKILPVSGVLYQINNNDTLPDVAEYLAGDMDRIVAYNGLSSPEAIEPGQIIICPDCKIPAPATPEPETVAAAQPTVTTKTTVTKPAAINTITTPKATVRANPRFPWGQCTYYASTRVNVTWGGNAGRWLANASAAGKATGSSARAGAIVVTNESPVGHVAYVESVNGSTITITEMNYKGVGIISTRTLPIGSSKIRGYIYP